jgi:hypothetical protein
LEGGLSARTANRGKVMAAENHRGAFVFGMLTGMVAGAVSTLFMTPRSGSQMRQGFKEQAGGVGQKVGGVTTTVRDRSEVFVGGAVDRVTRLAHRGGEADEVVVVSETIPMTMPETTPTTSTTSANADVEPKKEPVDAS